jgi:hypothetical protein
MKALLCMSIVVVMLFFNCGGEENSAPVINSVTANPTSTYPGEDVTLTCDAEDEDDDSITYDWFAQAGTLSDTNLASVTWTAPNDTGDFLIEVVVEDEGGLADTGSVTVTVDPNWVFGENLTATGIGANTYTYSSIEITGAPIGATVDSLTMTVSINHPSLGGLDIWLRSAENTTLMIWDSNYPGGTVSFTTDHFAGEGVNGFWQLQLYSMFTTGTLNWWEITIYWGL